MPPGRPCILHGTLHPAALARALGTRDAAARTARRWHGPCTLPTSMEIASLAIVLVFFALSWGFVGLCERVGE
jgi:hypothetical protein